MSAIKRALNKIPAALLRSPLHGLMSKRFLLLTFNGRKSGKRYGSRWPTRAMATPFR